MVEQKKQRLEIKRATEGELNRAVGDLVARGWKEDSRKSFANGAGYRRWTAVVSRVITA